MVTLRTEWRSDNADPWGNLSVQLWTFILKPSSLAWAESEKIHDLFNYSLHPFPQRGHRAVSLASCPPGCCEVLLWLLPAISKVCFRKRESLAITQKKSHPWPNIFGNCDLPAPSECICICKLPSSGRSQITDNLVRSASTEASSQRDSIVQTSFSHETN